MCTTQRSITGAGSAQGIGFACARKLHAAGVRVVITSTTDRIHIRARELDSRLYTVEEGHLDIVAKDTVLATVGPGDVLGEVSFIDDSPRTVSVRAGEENAVVRGWNKKTLSEALAFDPQLLAKFSVALCELLVERLRDTARRV